MAHRRCGAQLQKYLEELLSARLAELVTGRVNHILGDAEHAVHHLKVLAFEVVRADDERNQLVHMSFELISEIDRRVNDHRRKRRQTRAHKAGNGARLSVIQVSGAEGQDVVSRHEQTQQFGHLHSAGSNGRLFVEDVLVNNVAEDFLRVGLDIALHAEDNVVKLAERLFLQSRLERKVVDVLKDGFHQFVGVLFYDVASGLARRSLREKVERDHN